MYRFSERLAWVAGVVLPIGETWRRWGSLEDAPLVYLDDLWLGALFLIAASRSRRHGDAKGPSWLAAAIGAGCGMGYASWVATMSLALGGVDPATAAVLKAAMLVLGVVGLVGALRGPRSADGRKA